jgi:hypothetical protein
MLWEVSCWAVPMLPGRYLAARETRPRWGAGN